MNLTHPVVDSMVGRTAVFSEPLGAIVIGGFMQWFLQGIIIVQATQYYERYPDDSKKLRCFVAFMIILVLAQTGIESRKVWRVSVIHEALLHEKIAPAHVFLNGFIGGVNKIYLIRRCWRVTNQNRWVILLIPLTISTYITNILVAITTAKLQEDRGSYDHNMEVGIIAFTYFASASLVLDIILTGILAAFLWRNKTGLDHLDRALWGYFAIATESAAWPSLCMAIAVGLYSSSNPSSNRLVFAFLLMTGKLYTISLLRTLNARAKLHSRMKSHDLGRTSLSAWQWEQGAQDHIQSNLPMRSTTNLNTDSTLALAGTNTLAASICPLTCIPNISRQHLNVPPNDLRPPRSLDREFLVKRERSSSGQGLIAVHNS
ncbi:hypothetical protein BJ138DRAFT_597450 [Hygrophoropsis aurantiaca]|uniref:Uncharacterized protein n=1 Tax=Hygrophoropsis aurantiaca TaxID=72124 RepID=A0ACB8ASI1_9AGAM|nr:hypothetical protein BJ138DRAFT_597450 [Hygrophoropsis aurantiaca]